MRWPNIILVALPLFSWGQGNLVPNGDFEYYSSCIPNSVFYISLASPWETPTTGSPDYFNACCPPTTWGDPLFGVPENMLGIQAAHSGDGYAGFFAYSIGEPNLREYLQVELSEPLVHGIRYEVCFHVSLADKVRYAVNTLGAHLSHTAISRNDILRFEETPQILNAPANSLTSRTEWMAVCDTFTSRAGNERFITIGNFHDDAESGIMFIDSVTDGLQYKSYYYIDDVSVVALDSIPNSIEDQAEDNGRFSVYPNPNNGRMTLQHKMQFGSEGTVSLYSLVGERVYEMRLQSSGSAVQLQLDGLSTGLYLLRVDVDGRQRFAAKVAIVRE